MKGQTYVILAIVCTILISLFAVLNMASVEVNYLFWTGSSPLVFVILFSVLSGGVLTMLFGMKKIIHLRRENRRLSSQLQALERKMANAKDSSTSSSKQTAEVTKEKDE